MSNILICDDEKDIVSALRICLAAEGYEIFEAYNGIQALEIIEANDIHLVLLDIMMPEMDGISTLAKIRESYNMPVLFISAKSEDADKILGLNIGADDYITKPFNIIEVVARVKSNLRRYMRLGSNVSSSRIEIRGLCLDDNEKTVAVDGEEINLTPTEYEILKLIMQSPVKVFSQREIYERVWKETLLGSENTVAVHIRHLREKLEINPADPRYIKVVWGQGYKIQGAGR